MRCVTDFNNTSAKQEIDGSTNSTSVQTGQELGSRVAVKVRRTESVGRNIPTRSEPQEVSQRRYKVPGWGSQHTIHGWVRVVDGGYILRGELGQIVL